MQLGPVDPRKPVPPATVSQEWIELDRCLFESASIQAQHRVLRLLDDVYSGLAILANASPPALPADDLNAARLFLEMFAAGRVSSS